MTDAASIFALPGRDCLTREEHFGIKGLMLTCSVPHRDVLSVRGLWAPPYASSDFVLEGRLGGLKVATEDYLWDGNECRRSGRLGDLQVQSVLIVPPRRRAALLEFSVRNTGSEAVTVPVQFAVRGAVDEVSFWEFSGPGCSESATPWAERANAWQLEPDAPTVLAKRKEGRALAVTTDLAMDRWETLCGHWEGELALEAGESRTVRVAVAIGPEGEPDRSVGCSGEGEPDECAGRTVAAARTLCSEPEAVAAARRQWRQQIDEVFARVPTFSASDPRLTRFYNRSLTGLLLNQWQVPEFLLNPYYSTGGINGGCVCCYLWDFGEPWELLPLYDPAAVKSHVRQFLAVDLTSHFAWVPTSGEAFGPWYPVNQEKIIFLVYYYVLLTGDTAFLHETVGERTILDWMVYHATYRDHPDLPVGLIDYGKGNNHLELRGTFRYDNYVPDLNARRYANYLAVYELSRLAGQPAEHLPQRAEQLKQLLTRLLWNPQQRWFNHLDVDYTPHLRYTVQMFKLIGSGVLGEEQLEGLLSHLNDDEFLSAWGLHSMSKRDEAYDQVDIDNGGGGNYTAFTPQIIERLYKAGRPRLAEDLLSRILWWGERLPYWGDSIVANHMDYRQDTPLQATIGALAGAQMVIFGLMGVEVTPEGMAIVNPRPPSFSPELSLKGLHLRGRTLDLEVQGGMFGVTCDGEVIHSQVGVPVALPPQR